MASYHLQVTIMGRSEGRSVVAAAAYRSGARLISAETGVEHDYRRKAGVESSHLIAPPGAPDWARDRGLLWDAVEKKESRSNSQMSREIKVALPHELTDEQSQVMLLQWVRDNVVSLGMIADVCIHDPDPGEYGNRNRHAHIMTTMRELDPERADGWAKTRNRNWNAKSITDDWRSSWSEAQNKALELAGSSARVDHRSLADQREAALLAGDTDLAAVLDRPPEPAMGIAVSAVERRARAYAERHDETYEPVTMIGRQVETSRNLRSALMSAVRRLRAAIIGLSAVEAQPAIAPDPFAVADPFASQPIKPLPPTEDTVDDADWASGPGM